jgi:hypothetical protein
VHDYHSARHHEWVREPSSACHSALTEPLEPRMRRRMTLSRYEQIFAHVESFVLELDQLVRQAVIELVEQALARGIQDAGPARAHHGSGGGTGKSRAGAKRASQALAAPKAKEGGRRTGAELETLTDSLLKYIEKHPGSRMEQIAKGMQIPSKDLTLPLTKLKAEGHLKVKGQKRATAYFAK